MGIKWQVHLHISVRKTCRKHYKRTCYFVKFILYHTINSNIYHQTFIVTTIMSQTLKFVISTLPLLCSNFDHHHQLWNYYLILLITDRFLLFLDNTLDVLIRIHNYLDTIISCFSQYCSAIIEYTLEYLGYLLSSGDLILFF